MQVAIKEGLSLLGEADRHVELGARLLRHEPAQERDASGRHLDVEQEIGAGEGEKHQQLVFTDEQRVDVELAALVLQDRHREGHLVVGIDQPADDVGALVAEEERADHLDLQVRMRLSGPREMRA